MLGSISVSLTLQMDKNLRLDKEIGDTKSPAVNRILYLMAPLIQNFASMSNSQIYFYECVILEAYIS
jgi:hypothetical protein